jgi:hypothetical protein
LSQPDLAPRGFFLFDYPKEKLRGASFTTSDDLIFAIRQIFSEIQEKLLKNASTNRITRLSWAMKTGGKYYTKQFKESSYLYRGSRIFRPRYLVAQGKVEAVKGRFQLSAWRNWHIEHQVQCRLLFKGHSAGSTYGRSIRLTETSPITAILLQKRIFVQSHYLLDFSKNAVRYRPGD